MKVKELTKEQQDAFYSVHNLASLLSTFRNLVTELPLEQPKGLVPGDTTVVIAPTGNRQELQLKYVAENALQYIKFFKENGLDELEEYLGQLWDK